MTTTTRMRRWLGALLLPLSFLAAPSLAAAQEADDPPTIERPFLWRIETVPPSWLFGTIHLPDPRVTSLPDSVEDAIDGCHELYTELSMEIDEMVGAQALMMLPAGQTLKTVLPPELYDRVRAYLKTKKLSIVMFQRQKPWGLGMQIGLLEIMREMAGKTPLDMVLYQRAKAQGKVVGGLETIDEQIGVFDDLTAEQQAQFLEASLDAAIEAEAEGKSVLEELIGSYLSGDADALMELMHDYDWGGDDDELGATLEKRLLDDRNHRMADRIVGHLQRKPGKSFFFAVGAAHYPGETGVLKLLRDRGYAITQVGPDRPSAKLDARREALERHMRALRDELERLEAELAKLRKAG